jgi:hypothetical protein
MKPSPVVVAGIALTFVVSASIASSCSDTGIQREALEIRDSAGIRIVVTRHPASAERWTVDPEPTVEIGGDENDTTQILFGVSGGVVLGNGRIAIAQVSAPMVRWFDAAGVYQFGSGRAGGGPGEFGPGEDAWIAMLWPLPGDSVATWEHTLRRMQVFGPDGKYARAVVLDLPPNMPVRSYPQMVGLLSSGFVAYLSERSEPGALGEVARDSFTYIRYRSDGSYAGEIARVPGLTSFTRILQSPRGEVRVRVPPPFARSPVAWPSRDHLIYGSNDRYELVAFDSTGAIRTLIRRPIPSRALTSEMIEAYKIESMARAPADPARRRQWQDDINSAPYPDSLPAYRRIRVDRAGMLWVQDYELPGSDTVTWSIFDVEGHWISELVVPRDWQVLDIGADYLLVLVEDELDIERVRKYSLDRN